MSRVFYLSDIFQFIIDYFDNCPLPQQNSVVHRTHVKYKLEFDDAYDFYEIGTMHLSESWDFENCLILEKFESNGYLSENTVNIPGLIEINGMQYSIIEITDNAFEAGYGSEANGNITELELPQSITKIGSEAFRALSLLKSITLPENLETIGSGALQDAMALESITIPNKITEIPDMLCYYCEKLKRIDIGENVTSIGKSAFGPCPAIEEIHIKAVSAPSLNNSFEMSGMEHIVKVYVPAEAIPDYQEKWGNDVRLKGYIEILPEETGIPSGIKNTANAQIKITSKNGTLNMTGTSVKVEIYSIHGTKIAEYENQPSINADIPHGVYIIQTPTNAIKIIH